jgi:hypothetical protein
MSYPDKFNLESGSESDSDNIYSQPNPYSHMKSEEKEEADKKINDFDDYIKNLFDVYLQSLGDENINEDSYTADEIELENAEGHDEANFFYFIGRLNPPHDGHIYALKELVSKAMSKGSTALILLGSGPSQKDGDKRTFDNPITFELKKEFIEQQLQNIGAVEGTNYIIELMSTPHGDLARYIGESLKSKNISDIKEIKINHFAGGKDEDATKLKSILDYAEKFAASQNPEASISANVVVIEPQQNESGLKPMSATQVRNDAYKTYLDGTGYNGWLKQYKDFYGPMAQQIYEEILYPIYKLTDEGVRDGEIKKVIREYIETGKLPKTSKKSVKKSGGTKRGGTKRKQKNSKRKRNKNLQHSKKKLRKNKTKKSRYYSR